MDLDVKRLVETLRISSEAYQDDAAERAFGGNSANTFPVLFRSCTDDPQHQFL